MEMNATDSKKEESQPANTGELLPCPFCGENKTDTEITSHCGIVRCCDCGAQVHAACPRTIEEATKRWNTRTAPSDPSGPKADDDSYSQTIQELWELRAALTKERERADEESALKDEARGQRERLIKECERIGVKVCVNIGAPLTEAYILSNERAEALEKALERALDAIKVITSHEPYAFSDISPGIEIRAIESALASTAKAKLKKELGK